MAMAKIGEGFCRLSVEEVVMVVTLLPCPKTGNKPP